MGFVTTPPTLWHYHDDATRHPAPIPVRPLFVCFAVCRLADRPTDERNRLCVLSAFAVK